MTTFTANFDSREMSPARTLRAFFIETKYELIRILRLPAYAAPMLPLPILLYVLIGILVAAPNATEQPELPAFLFIAFSVFAVTSPGMYGFGQGFAMERQLGVLTLKRAQPVSAIVWLLAKILTAILCVLVTMAALIALATSFGGVSLSISQVAQLMAVSMLGMVAFCAIGLFIGSVVSGSAAPGIVALVFFPMMYLSGSFFPLPESLAPWAVIWPAFYLNQLYFAVVTGESFMSPAMSVAVLAGISVLFGGLAAQRLTEPPRKHQVAGQRDEGHRPDDHGAGR